MPDLEIYFLADIFFKYHPPAIPEKSRGNNMVGEPVAGIELGVPPLVVEV